MSIRKPSNGTVRSRRPVMAKSILETLESRQLLSATPIVGQYTPQQLRTAYGVTSLGLANQGQGVTIGIVDDDNDPNIAADLNSYSAYYNLPKLDGLGSDPNFSVVLDTMFGSVPNASAGSGGVGEETSLDVEMAHAMAPLANIILVEVPATVSNYNVFTELLQGIQLAATEGASSISLSYGIGESSITSGGSITSQNSTYLGTGSAASVSVSVSTGDGGTPSYPATSPNVIAVGGTSLFLASVKGNYSFETAWGGTSGAGAGGGGLSTNFATPTFQSANGVSLGKRSIPDVSLVADPVTGVSIYDSYDFGSASPWTATGGTSVSSPIFAGIMALAQQNRKTAGLAPLNSTQINTAIYSLYNSPTYSTFFHDVTLGANKDGTYAGFAATAGYDEATGVGSPIATTLIPYLSTYIPTSSVTVKLGGVGSVVARGITVAPVSVAPDSSDDDTSSVYDLLPSATGKTITPGFVKAVAQAQQSPVVSAVPLIDSVEIGTATHTVYGSIALLNAGQSFVEGGYSYGDDALQAAGSGLDTGDLGLTTDFLDSIGGSILSAVA